MRVSLSACLSILMLNVYVYAGYACKLSLRQMHVENLHRQKLTA